jgi:hypothetical protein
MFSLLRQDETLEYDAERLSDLLFDSIDFIKDELQKLTSGNQSDGDAIGDKRTDCRDA